PGEKIDECSSAEFRSRPCGTVELQTNHALPETGASAAGPSSGLGGRGVLQVIAVPAVQVCVKQKRAGQFHGETLRSFYLGLRQFLYAVFDHIEPFGYWHLIRSRLRRRFARVRRRLGRGRGQLIA